jgi:hypothetical protein
LNQDAEGIVVPAPRVLNQSGVTETGPFLLSTAGENFRVRHAIPAGPALCGSHLSGCTATKAPVLDEFGPSSPNQGLGRRKNPATSRKLYARDRLADRDST